MRVVEVRWTDASCISEEVDEHELPRPPSVTTWGLLVAQDEKSITVAAEQLTDPLTKKTSYRCTTVIPRSVIRGRIRTMGEQ